jgi:hypothetical protein
MVDPLDAHSASRSPGGRNESVGDPFDRRADTRGFRTFAFPEHMLARAVTYGDQVEVR